MAALIKSRSKHNPTFSHLRCCGNGNICAKQSFLRTGGMSFYQLSNFNMQDGIQDGSQDIGNVFLYFNACIPRRILHFFGNLHINILDIHLCSMSVQSNSGYNPLSARSLHVDVFVKFA